MHRLQGYSLLEMKLLRVPDYGTMVTLVLLRIGERVVKENGSLFGAQRAHKMNASAKGLSAPRQRRVHLENHKEKEARVWVLQRYIAIEAESISVIPITV